MKTAKLFRNGQSQAVRLPKEFRFKDDHVFYLIKQKPEKVLRHFKAHSVGEIGISSITLAELRYGVERSQQVQKNRQALEEFTLPLEIAAFDEAAAEGYGRGRGGVECNFGRNERGAGCMTKKIWLR